MPTLPQETWPQSSYLYPGPLLVRNTFIDDPVGRLDSLEGFLHERQAFSCPVSRISEPGSGVAEDGRSLYAKPSSASEKEALPQAPREDADSSDCSTVDTGIRGPARGAATPPEAAAPQFWPAPSLPPPPAPPAPPAPPTLLGLSGLGGFSAADAAQDIVAASPFPYSAFAAGFCGEGYAPYPTGYTLELAPQVLRLEDALRDEEEASAAQQVHQAAALAAARAVSATHEEQVAAANAFASASSLATHKDGAQDGEPSLGSAGHHLGQCRPCAFATTKGCSSGRDCQFCHLCSPGEKKRRQKAKRAFFGALAEMQRLALGEGS